MSSKKFLLSRPIHYIFYIGILQRDGKYGEEFKEGGGGRTHLIFLRGGRAISPSPVTAFSLTPDPSISVFAECYATEFNQFPVNLILSIL